MTQAPISLARLLAIAWCAAHPFAGAGCARTSAASTSAAAPALERRLPARLHVSNSNWSDVKIYLVRGGVSLRLGLVTASDAADFAIPPDFLTLGGSVTLVAQPLAGRGAYSIPLTGVMPGDALELTVEAFLQFSHLVVR